MCGSADDCRDADDNLLARLGRVRGVRRAVARGRRRRSARRAVARRQAVVQGVAGSARSAELARHRCDPRARIIRLGEQRDDLIKVGDRRRAASNPRSSSRRRTAEHAADRRRAGELEFHDLLVLCRSLLRDPERGAQVRRQLRRPLPAPAHRRVPGHRSDPGRDRGAARRHRRDHRSGSDRHDWQERRRSRPGALFFVGDPKQSIYRFRRADISTFLAARDHVAAAPLQLTCELPVDRARAGMDQPRVRPADPARARPRSRSTSRSRPGAACRPPARA